ncbi:MAG TPA: SGNH/GDSL hydrolase family protein [Alphaproteobacteria bacterium]|nr:SGNH/GDSL hydrolase family protein [Alphaproteobacteria bacterium]
MTRNRRARPGHGLGLAAALFLVLGGTAAAEALDQETTCAVPEEIASTKLPLPHVTAKLKAREAVRIVVIGSGSSSGLGASSLAEAYPARLTRELGKLFPDGKFELTNLSKRGQLASEMEARFASEVAAAHPALVIWQSGTADAVKGVDLASFGEVLETGIDKLRALDADVILMNSQYSPHTLTALDTEPYRDYMRWAILSRSAILFHRYTMMKYWVEEGVIDFSSPSKAEQTRNDDLVHGCIAYRLALLIESAVKSGAEGDAKE